MQILPSLFTCPICRKPLLRMENSYRCWSGHSYDLSAAGYIHLLPANKMHSKNPGDDKAMVAAGLLKPEIAVGWYFDMPTETLADLEKIRVKYMPEIESLMVGGEE